MKKVLTFITFCLLSPVVLLASHGMGGEITWKCQGGAYVFEMKFYRDCNGIPGPSTVVLTTNVPGVPTIPMMLISITDISPQGDPNSGMIVCPVCPSGMGSGGGAGAVQEYLFRSAPVTLPGIPPPSGWLFEWGECCRSMLIINLSGPNMLSMGLRAVMYPFTGFTAGQCNDNSPYFAEKPSIIACTEKPVEYNHFASDAEHDSLVYNWSYPVTSPPVTQQNFANGYSVTSQLPSQVQNQNNVPAALITATGQITFTSFNSGVFVTVVKVSSYRCGELTAEIFREINVLLNQCMIPVAGNPLNQPPLIPPPVQDSLGNWTYSLQVTAGDTVTFTLQASDSDPHPYASGQTVELTANSVQFGNGFTDPANGCLIPPCATLNPAPPVTDTLTVATDFNWVTDGAHLGYSFNCVQFSNVHTFLFKAKDNFCRTNGFRYKTVTITVVPQIAPPPVYFVSGQLQCPLSGPYRFQWFVDRWAITGADSSVHTPLQPGYYQVLVVDTLTRHGNYSNSFSYLVSVPAVLGPEFINVAPNPAVNGSFNLIINGINLTDAEYSITDMAGRIVKKEPIHCMQTHCSISINLNESNGIYLLRLKSDEGMAVKKIVVYPSAD